MPTQRDYRLAELAIKEGFISREKVNECLAACHRAEEGGSSASFAEVLVRRGELSQAEVDSLAEALEADKTRLARSFGAFEVQGKLSRGTWSNAYRAWDLSRDVEVRLRVLSPRLTEDESRRAALLARLKLASAVRHPAFIAIRDVGEMNGRVYVCQEPVAQVSLEEQVETNGPLAPNAACKVIRQVAAALQDVSASGNLPADLCPANLYLLPEGQIKVDGLGWSFREGLPEYSSPEELEGAAPDARSRVYSLGVCLYYLVTGTSPFGGTDRESLARMLRQGQPLASEVNLAVPGELALYIRKMMSPSPAARPGSLAETVHELDELQSALVKAELETALRPPPVAAGEASGCVAGPQAKAGQSEGGTPSPAGSASQDRLGTATSAPAVPTPPDFAQKGLLPTAPTPPAGMPVEPDAEDLHEEVETVVVGADTRHDLERIVHERREREQAKTVMLSESMVEDEAAQGQDDVSTEVPGERRERTSAGGAGATPFGSTPVKPAGSAPGGPRPGRKTGNRLWLALAAFVLSLLAVAAAAVWYWVRRGD